MSQADVRRADLDEIAASLFASLSKVANRLRSVELPRGFTPERLRTLSTINSHGPITVTALADMERVRPATISRMITSLESDGLIKRREDKRDKRSVLISTTSRGRQMFHRANQQYLKHMREAIGELDGEEAGLLTNLAALLENLSLALDRQDQS
jgi:DNA-binding MarR family transcriptional regulator